MSLIEFNLILFIIKRGGESFGSFQTSVPKSRISNSNCCLKVLPLDATLGTYTITYYATDKVGNQAVSVTRTVRVTDSQGPIITLNGQSELTLEVNSAFNDLGALVNDNFDEDLTLNINGTVNINVLGTYTITYSSITNRYTFPNSTARGKPTYPSPIIAIVLFFNLSY